MQLMISLDKKILDATSSVAQRMVLYGEKDGLVILIPHQEKKKITLSPNVRVISTGGNKLKQFIRLISYGKKILATIDNASITVQDPFFTGLAGVILRQQTQTTLEIQCHGDFFGNKYYKKTMPAKLLLGRWVIRKADTVRVVGERVKRGVHAAGVPEQKIIVRPVDIDIAETTSDPIDLRTRYDAQKVCIVVGRVEPIKNLSFLIELFATRIRSKYPGYKLLIIGDGSERRVLQQQVLERDLQSHIIFIDWTDPVPYMKAADALLLPSVAEGYGRVVLEARALGCRVIMNAVGVAGYEVQSDETTKIISIDRPDGWVHAMTAV